MADKRQLQEEDPNPPCLNSLKLMDQVDLGKEGRSSKFQPS